MNNEDTKNKIDPNPAEYDFGGFEEIEINKLDYDNNDATDLMIAYAFNY